MLYATTFIQVLKSSIDSQSRAAIVIVSDPDHGEYKTWKSWTKRWLGRCAIVHSAAMIVVDRRRCGAGTRKEAGFQYQLELGLELGRSKAYITWNWAGPAQ